MESVRLDVSGAYFGRLSKGSDLVEEVMAMTVKNGVTSGFFTAIGAVEGAVIGFYRQDAREYVKSVFDGPLELSSCAGNVMLKDGKLFVHAHACLSRRDGSTVGGHLVSAKVFAGEIFIFSFDNRMNRSFDEDTGLYLVDVPR
ncbi:MAG: DNA-binding protein [Candidatus Altiarchaeota archaeon]|nr:DNA-binding protein [Candidatus Altiarchaeota archaeon]